MEWTKGQPIYRQLRDQIIARVIDGSFPEGCAIPSVRQLATEHQINHLTVSRAYQDLVDLGLFEMRRGANVYVAAGARRALAGAQRQRFFDDELPAFADRVHLLGIDMREVCERLARFGAV